MAVSLNGGNDVVREGRTEMRRSKGVMRNPLDQSLTPSSQELMEVLSLFAQIFEGRQEQLLAQIQALYKHVQHKQSDYLALPPGQLRKLLITLYKIPIKREGYECFYRRAVAKTYCYYQGQYNQLRTLIPVVEKEDDSLRLRNNCLFQSTMTELVRQALLNIETKLANHPHFQRIQEGEGRCIQRILIKIDACLSKHSAWAFKSQIANIYSLEKPIVIATTDFSLFYSQLKEEVQQQRLKGKDLPGEMSFDLGMMRDFGRQEWRQQKPGTSQFQYDLSEYKTINKHHAVYEDDPQIWTNDIINEIVALFLQLKDVAKVRNIFAMKYAGISQLCEIGRIKRKFIKIIRASVRMFQRFYDAHKNDRQPTLPRMIEIDEDKMKLLIGSPYEIKALICQFYRQATMSHRSVSQMISEMNHFLKEKTLHRFHNTKTSNAIIYGL